MTEIEAESGTGLTEAQRLALAVGLERLGAVRLADSDYAYRADETGEWWICSVGLFGAGQSSGKLAPAMPRRSRWPAGTSYEVE